MKRKRPQKHVEKELDTAELLALPNVIFQLIKDFVRPRFTDALDLIAQDMKLFFQRLIDTPNNADEYDGHWSSYVLRLIPNPPNAFRGHEHLASLLFDAWRRYRYTMHKTRLLFHVNWFSCGNSWRALKKKNNYDYPPLLNGIEIWMGQDTWTQNDDIAVQTELKRFVSEMDVLLTFLKLGWTASSIPWRCNCEYERERYKAALLRTDVYWKQDIMCDEEVLWRIVLLNKGFYCEGFARGRKVPIQGDSYYRHPFFKDAQKLLLCQIKNSGNAHDNPHLVKREHV